LHEVKVVKVELNDDLFLIRVGIGPLVQKAFAAAGLRLPPRVQPLPAQAAWKW